ncbi:pyridoxamine 5'-phosphate oxidase family protein [Diaphorobacter aerolatus]|uniref:Pyridoxamine 5'-phosphate oxidase family protein n=1 Tax=Diaphorobacter aerolatus TaxID=1288495 RepID=A0A7H0GHB7_9BURK|nr:pyridoxamine 5'-phosphate oxidase family protein [Diaphorobacter aerolatus]QNP47683.1 pyridoxamine 5'-phosphate oxidase family protein [Diaphorobacter aerolatus]
MITTLEQLRTLYAPPAERAVKKQLNHLDAYCQRIIALSPFCVIATAGEDGALLDASPRGGPKGFVKCADAHHLLVPDAGGNNRLDSLTNLLRDPRVAMLFFVPGVDETLRVNGTARLRDEPEFLHRFDGERQLPRLVIEVQVQEAYLHCAKALMRSRLWDAGTQIERSELPTLNEIIVAQMGSSAAPETQADMLQRYRQQIADEQGAG